MTPKPYDTESQPIPVAAEPAAVYGKESSRMSVDEYFDDLWSLYLKKRGVAQ